MLREKIQRAIKNFNEIRKPEAIAELVELKKNKFLVKFSGHMCFTCGTYDYFEDLLYELSDVGLNAKIISYQNFYNYFLVQYQIVNKNFKGRKGQTDDKPIKNYD